MYDLIRFSFEVQLYVAKSLPESGLPWVDELAFRAAGKVLRDGDSNLPGYRSHLVPMNV